MRTALKWLGKILLFALIALCFAPTLVPPLLDRIYYQGPASDHFDGRRFFNPGAPPAKAVDPGRFFGRWRGERAAWPERVPVRQTVPPRRVGGGRHAGHLDRPRHRARPGRGLQHPDRPDLVGPRLACLLRRPAPGARAGRALRGSAEDRPRRDQPQSLRPYGPADAPPPLAARPADDRHQPRQRHHPARRRDRRRGPRLGTERRRPPRRRGASSSATIIGARAGAATATARSGRPSPSGRPAARSSSPATPAGATAAGRGRRRGTARSGSRSSRSAPTSRATSCGRATSIRRRRCASSRR